MAHGDDGIDEVIDLARDLLRLCLQASEVVTRCARPLGEALSHDPQDLDHHFFSEHVVADPIGDRAIDAIDRTAESVRAHRAPTLPGIGARVDLHANRPPLRRLHLHRTAALRADPDAGEEVAVLRSFLAWARDRPRLVVEAALDRSPELGVDDPELEPLDGDDARLVLLLSDLRAAPVALPELAPGDDADVARVPEDRPHAAVRPGSGSALAGPRARHVVIVQSPSDPCVALSGREAAEDVADDRGFALVHAEVDGVVTAHVVVAKDAATRVEATPRLHLEVLARALRDLLAFELGGEVASGDHELVERRVERHLFTREVVVERESALEDALDEEPSPIDVAAEPGLVARDDNVKGLRLRGVQERDHRRPLLELGPRHRVFEVDVGRVDGPTLRFNVAASLARLHIEARRLVLVRGSSRVDRSAHRDEV
ncbi:MAG: hypothetical protein L6R30_09550 [Thermoanaerobaculia bacterium]|nr:hypothetical protein [Thermoanaerobaculia bacterium]